MNTDTPNRLVIVDEQFEKIEGHYYEYDKSVVGIFKQHGFVTVIYGHRNMLDAFKQELNAKPWFDTNAGSKVRKIPVLGAILYRRSFWKKYEQQLKELIAQEKKNGNNLFLFFPNVYWYNILPIATVLKSMDSAAGLLYRVSIYDTIRLPKFILPVTLGIIRRAVNMLRNNKKVNYFTDSEVIAAEWLSEFKTPMSVLPIPHLEVNKKNIAHVDSNLVRMYLPGGMRVEKGAQMLTEAFEILAAKHPEILGKIVLVTQFLGGDPVLDGYKDRLAALPVKNDFLKHLSTEAYNEQLSLADVILIPYQVSEGYRARTSGILAESIASSKPFITTEGTWMSVQAKKYNTGLIVNDKQPGELAEAITVMVNSYPEFENKAIQACDKWMESQSKDVFYQQLVKKVE